VPTRGQAISIRAAVPAQELTLSSFEADFGMEYWFVRPGSVPDERPLVILGGARHAEGGSRGATADDSVIDTAVGKRLREFLPEVFPGKFENGAEPEMEWVRPTSTVHHSTCRWCVDRSLPANQRFP
jgi:hypothetical protein